ncbi:MAG: hypothetical protein A3H44_00100 [Gammaproteobacteria bacterium RIFCSPLOWO2_02_FULL_57_10]|nr:MAG: hypothetical protein A3H44_00100 [Gammaproteobacteria bacterium RIFCSPLOWO2_02_FULL_57_10]
MVDVMRTNFFPVTMLAALALLQACGSNYQAPLDDQSAVLQRAPAPIYSTTGTPTSVGAVISSTGVSTSATSSSTPAPATTTPARAVAAGVRVEPAAGVNVNVVNEQGGIRRSGISRAPLDSGTPVPSGTLDSPASSTPAAGSSRLPPAANSIPTTPTSVPTGGQTHTVARGETLYSIAWQYSLDYRALAVANNLAEPYTIYPDQRLTLNIGGVSGNALDRVPSIPAAPAGDPVAVPTERPAASVASRRTGNVPTREVENITWQWPVDGRVLRGFSAEAATTSRGIDIGASRGSPVYAAADGDVVYSGRGIQGQGDLIIIRHSARHLSAYSHNANMLVTEGARIRAGDKIAEVGTDTRGSELLHFEVRVDGTPVDPSRYLPPQ